MADSKRLRSPIVAGSATVRCACLPRLSERLIVAIAACCVATLPCSGSTLPPLSLGGDTGMMHHEAGVFRNQHPSQASFANTIKGDQMPAPSELDGQERSGRTSGWHQFKESYDKTRLVASITPRAAQRRRELAASPTQLSPASPVTEEESSSVLQRVNRAVSASNWEEEARMPGEREIAREEPASKLTISDNQHRLDTMALERMAVFNTPLPPGAPGRRETKEAQESLPVRLHHSDPHVERLYELAMQQKDQLEKILAVQRISNSTSSSAHALPRASRAQAPKPIVKVNLTERSLSMGLDSREGVADSRDRCDVDTGGPLAMHRRRGRGVRSASARSHDEIPLPSIKSGLCSLSRKYGEEKRQYDEVLEKLLLHGQSESERPGSAGPDGEAHSSIEMAHHETPLDFSSGDPNRFLNALDAHCEGLRTALANVEHKMGESHKRRNEEQAGGTPTEMTEVQQQGERAGGGVEEDGPIFSTDEQPRHNQCFSPLPTASPSVDRLAMDLSRLDSALDSAPAVEQLLLQHTLLQQQQRQQPTQMPQTYLQQQRQSHQAQERRKQRSANEHTHRTAGPNQHRGAAQRHEHQNLRAATQTSAPPQPEWIQRAHTQARSIAALPRLEMMEVAVGVLSLAAAAAPRILDVSPGAWGPGWLAVVNLAAGAMLLLRSAAPRRSAPGC